jgi:hypothetical protein
MQFLFDLTRRTQRGIKKGRVALLVTKG